MINPRHTRAASVADLLSIHPDDDYRPSDRHWVYHGSEFDLDVKQTISGDVQGTIDMGDGYTATIISNASIVAYVIRAIINHEGLKA